MAEDTDIQTQIEANAQAAKTVKIDGTETTEHSLTEQIAADQYLRATRGRSRRGCGVIFRKILPHGSVS